MLLRSPRTPVPSPTKLRLAPRLTVDCRVKLTGMIRTSLRTLLRFLRMPVRSPMRQRLAPRLIAVCRARLTAMTRTSPRTLRAFPETPQTSQRTLRAFLRMPVPSPMKPLLAPRLTAVCRARLTATTRISPPMRRAFPRMQAPFRTRLMPALQRTERFRTTSMLRPRPASTMTLSSPE